MNEVGPSPGFFLPSSLPSLPFTQGKTNNDFLSPDARQATLAGLGRTRAVGSPESVAKGTSIFLNIRLRGAHKQSGHAVCMVGINKRMLGLEAPY